MAELPKTFDPAAIESRWYAHWEERGLFRPERPDAEPWTIVNPPPNVTGSLHIGHALDNTLQDIMTRYERMRGKDALWVVGTDHAGIATQMVVERQLEERQDKRTNYSRDKFVDKVWEWKAESGGQITRQLRRLGCSMDWSREQFTMDPHFSAAVTKTFVDLHGQGLIYRDKRLVNWDPKLKTAISDLEVETREIAGHFWKFRYPLADGSGSVEVQTTRPETMLADMAVAVHPDDARYAGMVGKIIRQPITGRAFPVVADEHADPELGTGVVKITPGHDFNDFEVGKRAGIKPSEMLNMFDAEARVVQTADGLIPASFVGLDRFDARKQVVERMKADGFLVPHVDKDGAERDAEPRTIQQPYGDRGGVPIEPWLTDQWYVNAEELAKAPLDAVRSGAVEIVPKTWEKTFFNWMENIQPWCISRQLWWGHRIPAWYHVAIGDEGAISDVGIVVAENDMVAMHKVAQPGTVTVIAQSRASLEERAAKVDMRGQFALYQEEDVLDTWFSSALWPFATLGWPEERDAISPVRPALAEGPGLSAPALEERIDGSASSERTDDQTASNLLARHYPNDLLISGFDILFFWDARMMMMGQAMTGQNPWPRLYLHGLVRAPDGQKMSKSKGNVVDPLGLIDRYGADALRFFMAAMESQGRDIKMDERRVEGYRNFATKLWNAARFLQMNGVGGGDSIAAPEAKLPVNRWIIGEVVETLAKLNKAFDELRFDGMADAIYHFAWGTFCDWYVELIKGAFDEETKRVAAWAFDQILVMLHPFMPFVTEELWSANPRPYELIVAKWPKPEAAVDAGAKRDVEWLIDFVREVRAMRTELNVPWSATLEPLAIGGSADRLAANAATLARLVKLGPGCAADAPPQGSAQIVVAGETYAFPLAEHIDLAAEKARLAKGAEAAEKERDSLAARLGNANFTERAKPEAVEKARADHEAKSAEAERLRAALDRLG